MTYYTAFAPNTIIKLNRLSPRRREAAAKLLDELAFHAGKLILRSPALSTATVADDLHHLGLIDARPVGELLIVDRSVPVNQHFPGKSHLPERNGGGR